MNVCDDDGGMNPTDHWLTSAWPFVMDHLPAPPARVVELGCGPAGGFVAALRDAGYDAVGIDPEAPEDASYVRSEFERTELELPAEVTVASLSLHHVDDLDQVLDRVVETLVPSGTVVVLEWGWERFDHPTARWCFERLAPPDPDTTPNWLQDHRERWARSGLSWDTYIERWATDQRLHSAATILRGLDRRFTTRRHEDMPHFFCDLTATDRAAEEAAIATGDIRASGLLYIGTNDRLNSPRC